MANTSKANAADWAAMRMCPLFQHIGEAALRRIADKCRVVLDTVCTVAGKVVIEGEATVMATSRAKRDAGK